MRYIKLQTVFLIVLLLCSFSSFSQSSDEKAMELHRTKKRRIAIKKEIEKLQKELRNSVAHIIELEKELYGDTNQPKLTSENCGGNLNSRNRSNYNKIQKDYRCKLGNRLVIEGPSLPKHDIQEEGIVVVEIKVDRAGKVTSATPTLRGSTTMNRGLWEAARLTALKTKFNADPDAPAYHKGTITYIFLLD